MNVFDFIVAIILIGTIGGVLKARYGIRKDQWGNEIHISADANRAENAKLLAEIRALRERIHVLERVVTDTDGSARLDREIERLRDQDTV